MPEEALLTLSVNGEPARRFVPANRSLLDFVREDLGLTGSKHGCDVGDCGACTVLVDGLPRRACITLAHEVVGAEVTTIEGVPTTSPVVTAFDEQVAAQCGYCTPGFVLNLTALFAGEPEADDHAVREALGSNICRCTGYTKIIAAAKQARAATRGPQ